MSDKLEQAAKELCTALRPDKSKQEFVAVIRGIFKYLQAAGDACGRNQYHLNEHARHPDEVLAAKISKLVEEDCHHNCDKVYELMFSLMVELRSQLPNHTDNGAAGAGP